MKRILCLALSFLLCLFPLSALAADGDALIARQGMGGFDDQIRTICATGDTIWMLGEGGVYAYDASSGDMQSWPFDEAYFACRAVYDAVRQATVYQDVIAWFAWNGSPCALVQACTDDGIIDVWLARIEMDGKARFEAMRSVDWRPLDATGRVTIFSCVAVDDTLCAMTGEYIDSAELSLIPLDGSPTTLTGVRGREVCAYEGGVAVLRDDLNKDESTITAVDLATGAVRNLYRQDIMAGIGDLVQEAGSARILAHTDGYVVAIDPTNASVERVAPVSITTDQMGGASAVMLDAGLYASGGDDGVTVRRVIGRGSENIILNVDELDWSRPLSEVALALEQENPDISVAFGYETDVVRTLLTHSDEMDIIVGYSLYDGGNTALGDVLSRGYTAKLDSAVLKDYVGSMYPALRDLFMQNGYVVAVPLEARAEGLSVNLSQLEALGLTIADLPATWPEFFNFIDSAKGHGVPVLFGYEQEYGRQELLRRLIADASLEIEAGRMEHYDSPEMLEALEAFDRVDWQAIFDEADPQMVEANALVDVSDSVDVSAGAFDSDRARYPLHLSFSADRPAIIPVNCMVAYVNPSSHHIEEATALLEAAVQRVSHVHRATLSPSFGEPEIDEVAWRRADDELGRQIESLQARVDAGDISAQGELNACLSKREGLPEQFRLISQDSLDWYRAHDDCVMLAMTNELDEIDLDDLILHCIEQNGSAVELARDVEKQAAMRRLER